MRSLALEEFEQFKSMRETFVVLPAFEFLDTYLRIEFDTTNLY